MLFSAQSFAAFTDVYFFGDSLMDNGSPVAPPLVALGANFPVPPYATGRYSNGNVWTETFASELGFTAEYGVNSFAVGGAVSADLTTATSASHVFFLAGASQVGSLRATPGGVDPGALRVFGIGGNDYFNATISQSPLDLQNQILSNTRLGSEALQAEGAQHFLVLNATDTSISPILGTEFRGIAEAFNEVLQVEFGDDHMIFNSFAYLESVRGNYLDSTGTIGIDIGEDAATCLSDPVCGPAAAAGGGPEDSTAFLLFDDIHPTREFHADFGTAVAASVVPLPAPLLLLVAGLGVLRAAASRKSAAWMSRALADRRESTLTSNSLVASHPSGKRRTTPPKPGGTGISPQLPRSLVHVVTARPSLAAFC
ncbi:MAG: phospholipase/lecithinase/hemolysin [Gammaproteobacteria bacterium]